MSNSTSTRASSCFCRNPVQPHSEGSITLASADPNDKPVIDRTDDGGPHPDMQLNIMNSRICEMVAGSRERMPLAGDQLIVDLDLSEANLPPWTKLAIGDAVIEITDQPHNGCAKFTRRFGLDAQRFVNSPLGKELHLRGLNARVVTPGTIREGDTIRKI